MPNLSAFRPIFLFMPFVLAACANPVETRAASSYEFAELAAPRAAGIRLTVVITARTSAPEAILFEGGNWLTERPMAHSAVLVCHRDGLVMFDTGLGRQIDSQFEDMPLLLKPLLSYEVTSPVADQVDLDVFCPGRPLEIALSHMHWDHASAIEDFPDTPVFVPDSELASARQSGNGHGYLASQFDDPDIDWRGLDFTGSAYRNYPSSLDRFGDGSVVFVPMDGHSAGSMGLFVNMPDGQSWFFTGDTSWSLDGFTRPAHKNAIIRVIVDRDVAGVEQELQRVHALLEREPGLVVIPAHDFNAYPPEAIYPRVIEAVELRMPDEG
ncbi:MBL fold metallo-hydrolase [uncultured Maricaulis sp.]|uniref:MBL fold metallo-hydrolase n=1 Tax=uncultured Maricaulis sp. TaxID=174710 RepID=UPI0030DCE5C0|tara:strand:+ start:8014 stop:8988 length:975 start_codon:yes stop_codon:yes gene_type:complete